MKKVQGHPNLSKATSGAVLNTDKGSLEAARKRKASRLSEKTRIEVLENDMEALKKQLQDILNARP